MKKLILMILLMLGVAVDSIAQTYKLNTNHQSISMQVKDLGWTADIYTANGHVSETYIVSYTVEFTLTCGGTKTYTINDIEIAAGKTDNTGGYTISIPEVKGCNRGVSSARLVSFNARLDNTSNNNGSSAVSTADNVRLQLNNYINSGKYSEARSLLDSKGHLLSYNEVTNYRNKINTGLNPQSNNTANDNRNNNLNAIQNSTPSVSTPSSTYSTPSQSPNYNSNNVYNAPSVNDKALENKVVEGMYEIADLWVQSRQERIEREEREEAQRRQAEYERIMREQQEAELKAIKAAELARKINNRKAVIAEFPVKDIPLGSQEKAEKIYYFIYAYDNTINNEYGAKVYVSNVFEIGKYNDGTRAYTSTIKNEIENLTPVSEILHGYYYSLEEAEKFRSIFISILKKNDVTLVDIMYKGKPKVKNNTTNNITEVKENSSKYDKIINMNDDPNFAPAQIKTPTPGELPSEQKNTTESKYNKIIKIE